MPFSNDEMVRSSTPVDTPPTGAGLSINDVPDFDDVSTDSSLCEPGTPLDNTWDWVGDSLERQAKRAQKQIVEILRAVFDDLDERQGIMFPYRRRGQSMNETQYLSFPGGTPEETALFTRLFTIMEMANIAICTDRRVSKRNVYYQNKELFGSQAVVDRLVDDLAYTFGVHREALYIVASTVGLLAGKLDILMPNGMRSSLAKFGNAMPIPSPRTVSGVDLRDCRWILVIEKEATFGTLVASGYWNRSIAGKGVLVTSKGYPTLVTRQFLHFINRSRPQMPIFGLVDYDPHGIRIFRTYKYGSASLRHEKEANVPGLQWLGIQSSDLLAFDSSIGRNRVGETEPLTAADRKTAVHLLHDIQSQDQDASARKQMREVQVMLMLSVKAEIQAADDHGDLAGWLDGKLGEAVDGMMDVI